jgi:uncharacterized membrane protein
MEKLLFPFVLAMLPISELRGAIPYAWAQGVSPLLAYIISVLGNLVPIPFLLLLLGPVSKKLRKFKLFDKFFSWWFSHALKRSKIVEKYEAIGLLLFVAIPLPVTGAWTGSVVAFLLGFKFKIAFPIITLGVGVAGIIVTIVCMGIVNLPWVG